MRLKIKENESYKTRFGEVSLSFLFNDPQTHEECYEVWGYDDDKFMGHIKFSEKESITPKSISKKVDELYGY